MTSYGMARVPFIAQIALAAAIGGGGYAIATSASLVPQGNGASCNIKGNVSIDTGERIYHVPGQRYYSETRIDPRFGERYFCSEAEARNAGWRKSRV